MHGATKLQQWNSLAWWECIDLLNILVEVPKILTEMEPLKWHTKMWFPILPHWLCLQLASCSAPCHWDPVWATVWCSLHTPEQTEAWHPPTFLIRHQTYASSLMAGMDDARRVKVLPAVLLQLPVIKGKSMITSAEGYEGSLQVLNMYARSEESWSSGVKLQLVCNLQCCNMPSDPVWGLLWSSLTLRVRVSIDCTVVHVRTEC